MHRINLDNEGSELLYIPNWLSSRNASNYFTILLHKILWQEEEIPMFGKIIKVPRLIAWYGNPGTSYKYSGINHIPLAWIPELYALKKKLDVDFNLHFNSMLANLYRSGSDHIGWHSDDEKALGLNPIIASISLGATRTILFKNKENRELIKMNLENGSLLIMKGEVQQFWKHSLPKMPKIVEPRINLTFRTIC